MTTLFHKIKLNLIFTLFSILLFVLIELTYRYSNPHMGSLGSFEEYFVLFVIFFLISFTKKLTALLIVSGFFIFYLLQTLHFSYFGFLVFPLEIYLFFTKQKEILETFLTLGDIILITAIGIIISWLLFWKLNTLTVRRKNSKILSIF